MSSGSTLQATIHANAMHRCATLCLSSLILDRRFFEACPSGDLLRTELEIARREVA
jgi:hypothetical protein